MDINSIQLSAKAEEFLYKLCLKDASVDINTLAYSFLCAPYELREFTFNACENWTEKDIKDAIHKLVDNKLIESSNGVDAISIKLTKKAVDYARYKELIEKHIIRKKIDNYLFPPKSNCIAQLF